MDKSDHPGTYFMVVCLMLSGLLLPTTQVQGHSSCKTSGTVLEGHPANIFCNFSRPYQNFIVYRLPSSRTSDENTRQPKIAVVCTLEGDRRTCDLGEHSVTTTSNRQQATIEIPAVRQEHSGEYFCKTQPAKGDDATSCTLTVQSVTVRRQDLITCNTKFPVPIGQKTSIVCEFSKSIASAGITLTKQGITSVKILHCDSNRQCMTLEEGYAIQEASDTHVRISIPSANFKDAGEYVCSSDLIEGVSGKCTLELTQAVPEKDAAAPVAYISLVISVGFVILAGILFLLSCLGVWKKCQCRPGISRGSRQTDNTNSEDSKSPCLGK